MAMELERTENQEVNALSIIDTINIERVSGIMNRINQFQQVVHSQLKPKVDFGVIPGTGSKPTLLKPGAEKILMLMGVTSEYELIERVQDYEKGFFAFTVRCILSKRGQVVTEGLGHCNSREKKYTSDRADPYTIANTCLKMAKKRAQVDATLTVAALSEVFTQDIEDMDIEGSYVEPGREYTREDAADVVVTFGKYRGSTLNEILAKDKGYVQWLAKEAKQQDMRNAAQAMLADPKDEYKEEPKAEAKQDKADDFEEQYQASFDDDNELPF